MGDLVWSEVLGKLLLSNTNMPGGGGTLLTLEPLSLAVNFGADLGPGAGKLELADDGSRLYAALDYQIRELNGLDLVWQRLIPLDPQGGLNRVGDMRVLPAAPESIVIGRLDDYLFKKDLPIFDRGVMRSNAAALTGSNFRIETGDAFSPIFVQDTVSSAGFSRYLVHSNGTALLDVDTTLLPKSVAVDLEWADGLLFTSVGTVLDPVRRVKLGTIPTITANSLLCYDSAVQRVYYLTQRTNLALLQAIDPVTLGRIDMREVPGVAGTLASLIRWGGDGLAFRTTAGQLFILRSSLVPSGAPADLGLSVSIPAGPVFVGSNLVVSFTVTNNGPSTASNCLILIKLPPNAGSVSAEASQGACEIGMQSITARLGALSANSAASLSLRLVPAQPGVLELVGKTTSDALDPDSRNNMLATTNSVLKILTPGSMAMLSQVVADLVWNPVNDRLYLASGAQILMLNPVFTQVEFSWPLPGPAGRLALSDDGEWLYAVLNQGSRLVRLSSRDGQIDLDLTPAATISDIAVIPGQPRSFVLSMGATIAVFDNAIPRPQALVDSAGAKYLEFGAETNVVYGNGSALSGGKVFRTLQIDAAGIRDVAWSYNVPYALGDFKFDAGYLYANSGDILDPHRGVVAGSFPGAGANSLVQPNTALQRVFFLTPGGPNWQIRAYLPSPQVLVESTSVTNVQGTPTAFVRWGTDGLAFCTSSNQVFLMRSVVPAGPPADLAVLQTAAPDPVWVGSNLVFTLTITNAGPNHVTDALLFNRVPTNATLSSVLLSQGTHTRSNNLVVCHLGPLSNGAIARVWVTLLPQQLGDLINFAAVTSSALDNDPANNLSTVLVHTRAALPPEGIGIINLPVSDLAYHPSLDLIFATPADDTGPYANALVIIDPATGLIGPAIPVAPQLSQIALSDDGTRLYVLAKNGKEIHRLSLPSGIPELRVRIADVTQEEASSVLEIKPVPGLSESVAVVLQYPGTLGLNPTVAIFDNSAIRPGTLQTWQRSVEFVNTNWLVGFEWMMVPSQTTLLELMPTGLVERARGRDVIDGSMKADAGLIYTTSGSVFSALPLAKLGNFGVSGLVAPDHDIERVFFLTQEGSVCSLRAFDQRTYGLVGVATIPGVMGTPSKFLRCGGDRLACLTTGGQIIIIRTCLIPTADLAVACTSQIESVQAARVSL